MPFVANGIAPPLPANRLLPALSVFRSMRIVALIYASEDSISARNKAILSAIVPAGSLLPSRREAK